MRLAMRTAPDHPGNGLNSSQSVHSEMSLEGLQGAGGFTG